MSVGAARLPARVAFILPCCIGDAVLATAALGALRRLLPDAHITWAVGGWARPVVGVHPAVDAWLDTGPHALPTQRPGGLLRFAAALRAQRCDAAVSLVRSWTMGAAVALAGVPVRAGPDSAGRGFAYTVRVPVVPDQPEHEADLYLRVIARLAASLGLPDPTPGAAPALPVDAEAQQRALAVLATAGADPARFWLVHAGGGHNPGMTLDVKRYPPPLLADLAARMAKRLNMPPVLIGGPGDRAAAAELAARLAEAGVQAVALAGALSLGETAAAAARARLYLGPDTGLTHAAAAVGAPTAMLMGPSDPRRYAPRGPRALALWRPGPLQARGVAAGAPDAWSWAEHGIAPAEAEAMLAAFLEKEGANGPPS